MKRSKPFINKVSEGLEDGSNDPRTLTAPPATIPMPGTKERKKKPPEPRKPKSRPRKLLSAQELAEEEVRLEAKYPHLVKGTLLNATKGNPTAHIVHAPNSTAGLTDSEIEKYRHKRSCLIKCTCGSERRIATSDLAQVTLCPTCTRNERNARKRQRRAKAKK